ncbi:hypothetical protein T4B_6019 [Trichinella pseudospiralis]|uniref:Uncharacterized protein n=1 Tax=Trichinella pseudospiralis TaxID=6337 RepID=A0A0V1IHR7_TRIPS|nr:hypothetical protein T4B_6019 [Trichinella pseudospiralis]
MNSFKPNKTLLPDSDLVSSSISNTGIDVREIYSSFQVQNFTSFLILSTIKDELLTFLVALMPFSDADRLTLGVALLRKMFIFPSSIAGVGNLLWDRCWMPCKWVDGGSHSFKVNFQENSLFLLATRVLTVVITAYMRKTADPPNPAQNNIRDSHCHIMKTFVLYFLLSRYVAI